MDLSRIETCNGFGVRHMHSRTTRVTIRGGRLRGSGGRGLSQFGAAGDPRMNGQDVVDCSHTATFALEAIELSERTCHSFRIRCVAVCATFASIRDDQIKACAATRRRGWCWSASVRSSGDPQRAAPKPVPAHRPIASLVGSPVRWPWHRLCPGYGRRLEVHWCQKETLARSNRQRAIVRGRLLPPRQLAGSCRSSPLTAIRRACCEILR